MGVNTKMVWFKEKSEEKAPFLTRRNQALNKDATVNTKDKTNRTEDDDTDIQSNNQEVEHFYDEEDESRDPEDSEVEGEEEDGDTSDEQELEFADDSDEDEVSDDDSDEDDDEEEETTEKSSKKPFVFAIAALLGAAAIGGYFFMSNDSTDADTQTPPTEVVVKHKNKVQEQPSEQEPTQALHKTEETPTLVEPLDLGNAREALSDEKASSAPENKEIIEPVVKEVQPPKKEVVIELPKKVEPKVVEPAKKLETKQETKPAVAVTPKVVAVEKKPEAVVVKPLPVAPPRDVLPPQAPPARETTSEHKSNEVRIEGNLIPLAGETSRYYLIEKKGTRSEPVLLIKKVGVSGVQYSRRTFNCVDKTTSYLGSGETIEEMNASKPDTGMSEVKAGSAAWQIMKYACRY